MRQIDQRVRWGIIGVGDVVEHKSGPAFASVPGSELVAVMRRDTERARDFARRHQVPRWYGDADELIMDGEVDAVYVATPPDSHAQYARAAMAAGKPVYVEKPMARTEGECRTMIDTARANDVPLFVAYYRRALPRFEAAREAIRSGRVGEARGVVVRHQRPAAAPGSLGWRVDPAVSGGGLFVDLASHTLDWLDHVFGPVADLSGTADGPSGSPTEDRVVARFTLGDENVPAVALWDFAAADPVEVVEVVGTTGTLRISMFTFDPVTITGSGGTELLDVPTPAIVQEPMVANVVDCLRGRATPLSTGDSAIRTARVVDTLLAEHRRRHGLTAD